MANLFGTKNKMSKTLRFCQFLIISKIFLLFWCYFFTIMAVYENNEKYDMLVCFIQSNENPQEASELYLQR